MSDTMTAAVFGSDEPDARFERLAQPELRPDEVLVRLAGCGICHADILARDGNFPIRRPFVLGHEGSGYVEKVGSKVRAVAVGDPVVLTFMTCGTCPSCLSDETYNCWQKMPANFSGRRIDGTTALRGREGEIGGHFFGQSSFATHSVANERNVVKVRADAPIHLMGPLGCGIQTGAGSVFNLLKPRPGQSLAVFGGGGVGLSAVLAGVISQCSQIVVIEPNETRRALALELGATSAIDPIKSEDLVAEIKAITGGGIDRALDTSGRLEIMNAAWRSLLNGGSLVVTGASVRDSALPIPVLEMINRGLTLRGAAGGNRDPHKFIPYLVDLYMDGKFPFDRFVRCYPLDDLERALKDQEEGSAVKPVVIM